MLIDFLLENKEYVLALHTGNTFFNSVNIGFMKNGVFYEKYNCLCPGSTGKGVSIGLKKDLVGQMEQP
jgi:hypothetical protein